MCGQSQSTFSILFRFFLFFCNIPPLRSTWQTFPTIPSYRLPNHAISFLVSTFTSFHHFISGFFSVGIFRYIKRTTPISFMHDQSAFLYLFLLIFAFNTIPWVYFHCGFSILLEFYFDEVRRFILIFMYIK